MDESVFETNETLIANSFCNSVKESQVIIHQKNQIQIISMPLKHERSKISFQ